MEEEGNEEEKINLMEGLSLTKVSDVIDSLIEKEDLKELKILKERLIKFKEELEKNIIDKKPIEHESFKKNLYKNLEKTILSEIYIKDPDVRKEKIHKTYVWFFDHIKRWNSLDKIKYRTDKNADEKYKPEEVVSDDIVIKDDEYEQKEFKLHRTDIPGLEPPKERLQEYTTKKIKLPEKFRKNKATMENLRFNVARFHGRVGSANNMIQMKPNKFYSKTGSLWFNPTTIPVNEEYYPIDVRKEVKSAYSFNRPPYEYALLNIEKKIMDAKNNVLKEKRNNEEIKKFMEEAAIAKAKYKGKREFKFNIDNIVKEYEKNFKINKDAEKIIKENKIEENNKDAKIKDFKNINLSYKNLLNSRNNKNSINDQDNKNIKKISNNIELNRISSKFPNCFSNINNKIIYTRIKNRNKSVPTTREEIEKEKEKEVEKNNDNEAIINENENNEQNKIRNDNIENDLILEKKEDNYKISLNANKSELFEKIKKDQEQTSKIKYDTVSLNVANDRVFKTRVQSAKMCDVKEIAPKKMDYAKYYVPLSAYDEINYKTYTKKFILSKSKHNRPKTASEFALRNFTKYENNYLALRQEMIKYYGQEKDSMNKLLYKKLEKEADNKEKEKDKDKDRGKNFNNSTKSMLPNVKRHSINRVMSASDINIKSDALLFNKTFEQMFERPLEGPPRSIYFLPKHEIGLLKNPFKGKKKKKGKNKKKKF